MQLFFSSTSKVGHFWRFFNFNCDSVMTYNNTSLTKFKDFDQRILESQTETLFVDKLTNYYGITTTHRDALFLQHGHLLSTGTEKVKSGGGRRLKADASKYIHVRTCILCIRHFVLHYFLI